MFWLQRKKKYILKNYEVKCSSFNGYPCKNLKYLYFSIFFISKHSKHFCCLCLRMLPAWTSFQTISSLAAFSYHNKSKHLAESNVPEHTIPPPPAQLGPSDDHATPASASPSAWRAWARSVRDLRPAWAAAQTDASTDIRDAADPRDAAADIDTAITTAARLRDLGTMPLSFDYNRQQPRTPPTTNTHTLAHVRTHSTLGLTIIASDWSLRLLSFM